MAVLPGHLRVPRCFPLIFQAMLSFPVLPGWPFAEAALAKKLMQALAVPLGVNRPAGPQRPAAFTIHTRFSAFFFSSCVLCLLAFCCCCFSFFYKLIKGSGRLISREVRCCTCHGIHLPLGGHMLLRCWALGAISKFSLRVDVLVWSQLLCWYGGARRGHLVKSTVACNVGRLHHIRGPALVS